MAIGAILFLFCLFVFLTVMSTKTWRWFHVTIVFFVFIAANFIATIATVSWRTRAQWQGEYAAKKADLDKLKKAFRLASQGTAEKREIKPNSLEERTKPKILHFADRVKEEAGDQQAETYIKTAFELGFRRNPSTAEIQRLTTSHKVNDQGEFTDSDKAVLLICRELYASGEYIPVNMFDVRSRLGELMMYRGKVWRGAKVDTVTNNVDWNQVTIKLTTLENPNQISAKEEGKATRLYAFKEVVAPNQGPPVADEEPAIEDDPVLDDQGLEEEGEPNAENVPPPSPVKVPVVYMGEFDVVSSGADDVTLKWTFAPSRTQRIHLTTAKDGPSWVLYKQLPVDGHQAFSYQLANKIQLDEKDPGTPDQNDKTDKENTSLISPLFGKMDAEQIKKVFSMVVGNTFPRRTPAQIRGAYTQLITQNYYPNEGGRWNQERAALIQILTTFDPDGVPDDEKEEGLASFFGYPNPSDQTMDRFLGAIIRDYRRDGYRGSIEDDELADVWAKVKFTKALKFKAGNRERPELIVDGAENEQMDRFFDDQGRAIKGRLRRGEPVEFNKNDLAVFPIGEEDSDSFYRRYDDEELFETLYYIYVRPLNGYSYHFYKLSGVEDYLLGRIQHSQKELLLVDKVIIETTAEIKYRTEERGKLNSDLENYRREEAFLKTYESNLTTQELALRQEVGQIYQRNQELANELKEITLLLTQKINERTDAVPPPSIP